VIAFKANFSLNVKIHVKPDRDIQGAKDFETAVYSNT